jgi:hypothetical protein
MAFTVPMPGPVPSPYDQPRNKWKNRAAGLGSVLGGMDASMTAQGNTEDAAARDRDRLALESYLAGLEAPGVRLDTSMRASHIKNAQPVTAKWGGPGSGLRGETVKFSGGYANPNYVDPRARQLADDVLLQELEQQGVEPLDWEGALMDSEGLNALDMFLGKGTKEKVAKGMAPRLNDQRRRDPNRGGPPSLSKPKKDGAGKKILKGIGTGVSLIAPFL